MRTPSSLWTTYAPSSRRAVRTCYLALALGIVALTAACESPVVPDLNNPSQSDFETITDAGQLQELLIGYLDEDRGDNSNEILYGETIGRDGYRITGAEPRFITDLLGESINPSNFLGNSIWPYDAIQLVDIAIAGIDSAPPDVLTDEQKASSLGVFKTFKALSYLRVVETRDTAGVPINTDLDPLTLSTLHCKADALNFISALLDTAAAELAAGGTRFVFELPDFAGMDDPAGFLTFNRALAAKADFYRGFIDYAATGNINRAALTEALAEIDSSFIDTTDVGALDAGAYHVYSTASGDATNPLFENPASTRFRANPQVTALAEAGDQRVARTIITGDLISGGGDEPPEEVSSDLIYVVYTAPNSPIPILTNTELILLKAEILWGLGQYAQALDLTNYIRVNDAGLAPAPASLAGNPQDLLTEILRQKRYSLLWESAAHWIDHRLFGRLDQAPPVGLGQARGFDPIRNFPIPFDEQNARSGDLSKTCESA